MKLNMVHNQQLWSVLEIYLSFEVTSHLSETTAYLMHYLGLGFQRLVETVWFPNIIAEICRPDFHALFSYWFMVVEEAYS